MFKTCIIDPPWAYANASKNPNMTGFASQQYEMLGAKDLAALPVGDVVSDYIFMWTVGPFIRESLYLLDAWGFEYRTQLVWTKSNGKGVGYWFRGSHELVLMGSKKDSKAIRTNESSILCSTAEDEVGTWLETLRTRHSRKPDALHRLIEKHFPGPWLEIFGRYGEVDVPVKKGTEIKKVDFGSVPKGWIVLGNQAPGDGGDIRKSLLEYTKKKSQMGETMTEQTCSKCGKTYKKDSGYKHRDGLCVEASSNTPIIMKKESEASTTTPQNPYSILLQKIEEKKAELAALETRKKELDVLFEGL